DGQRRAGVVGVHARHSAAGHAGHMPVPAAAGRYCPCGRTGHAEAVASGPAMTARYGGGTGLPEIVTRAGDGDLRATMVLAEGATALGQLVGGLVNLLDPEIVLIGGGVAECGGAWWETLCATARAELLPPVVGVPIRHGRLGGSAAILGAARLAWEAR
ncbi:ROK family protein, partial [Actinoplanes sp. NPDC024001]|uniref:ROK family protein n=1 Tax=Actinoplanes sp. NPDC024001 TaxID=3154598 RepID=UPI0033C8D895